MDLKQARQLFLNHCKLERGVSKHTIRAYQCDTDSLTSFMNEHKIEDTSDIEKDDILNWLGHISQEQKPRSVKRKITVIKSYISYLKDEGHISEKLSSSLKIKIPVPKRLPRRITSKQLKSLLGYLRSKMESPNQTETKKYQNTRNFLMAQILSTTGIRVSELSGLTWKDFNKESNSLLIQGKGDKERIIPLLPQNISIKLVELKNEPKAIHENEGYIFKNQKGSNLSDQSVRSILKEASKGSRIGIHVTPHMLRHTFASLLVEAGTNIRIVQILMGHQSIQTTELYSNVETRSLAKEIRKVFTCYA